MSSATRGGRHRRRAERVTIAGALPVAIAIAYSTSAVAAPAQQPGVGAEVAPAAQPGTPADEAPTAQESEPKEYWVAPPAEYDNVQTRPAPTTYYENDAPVAPAAVGNLHLPVEVEPVAPIEAPEERLRLGDYVADQPNWMSDTVLDRTNNSAAAYEAQVNTFWRSTGVEASRADRIGAATIGGAVVGGIGTAAAWGVPAAVAGGLIGGTIGGTSGLAPLAGAAVGAQTLIPVALPIPVITTAMGGAIGAAVVGIPTAVVAGGIGAAYGAAQGMAFGAGDTLEQPAELDLDDMAIVDAAEVTASTRDAIGQVVTYPGGAQVVAATRDATEWVPTQVAAATEQVRTAALAQPGGAEFVGRVDALGADAADIFSPLVDQVVSALTAVQAGLV